MAVSRSVTGWPWIFFLIDGRRDDAHLTDGALTIARNFLTGILVASAFCLGSLSSGYAQTEPEGNCRAAVRPLLAAKSPDPERLNRIKTLCRDEADAGDPMATYQLSFFYLGLGGWDPEKATDLMFSAAERGIPEAQYWLAWQYDAGPLLSNEPELALTWYQRAAESDHPLALYRLAKAYDGGELGLKADAAKATEFRARAARCANQNG
jgi:TPR repeat protein